VLSKKTSGLILYIVMLLPLYTYAQQEEGVNRNANQLNFECSISNCNLTFNGIFENDLGTLRNDAGTLFSGLGPDIYGEPEMSTPTPSNPSVPIPVEGHPIAYTSGQTLKIKLYFEGVCAVLSTEVKVRGISSSGFEFPPLSLMLDPGNNTYFYNGEASTPFTAEKVDLINLETTWQMQSPGNQAWEDIGVTKNQIYVTLKPPIAEELNNLGELSPGYKHYESCFFIGCNAADGSITEESVIEKVWDKFEGKAVKKSTGELLRYYHELNWEEAANNRDIFKLLDANNGQCTAWCELFLDILKVLGVAQDLQIVTIDHSGPAIQFPIKLDGFFVKKWEEQDTASYFDDFPQAAGYFEEYNYNLVVKKNYTELPPVNISENNYAFGYKELTQEDGVVGQGSANPESIFDFHQVCKIGNFYYDPSYGSTPYNSSDFLNDFQDENIVGFFKAIHITGIIEGASNIGIDLNGDMITSDDPQTMFVFFVKLHDPEEPETIIDFFENPEYR